MSVKLVKNKQIIPVMVRPGEIRIVRHVGKSISRWNHARDLLDNIREIVFV